jgi:cytoskeleton protein RodZ
MGVLGLKQMREATGMTLEEMSRVTRIGKGHLEALEAEDYSELPAPVFVKGFLRAYCDALQQPSDEVLARYRDIVATQPPVVKTAGKFEPVGAGRRSPLVPAVVLLVLLAASLAVVQFAVRQGPPALPSATGPEPGRGAAGVQPSSQPLPGVRPAPPSLASPELVAEPTAPAAAAQTTVSPQRLIARTSELTWVRVQADRGDAVQELLPAGATREWTAERQFVLTIGNAGGIELELNGRRIAPLGARGTVVRDLILPRQTGERPGS